MQYMINSPMCYIKFSKVEDVTEFVKIADNCNYDINLFIDKFNTYIDGKSLLGILSMDLRNPIGVNLVDANKLNEFLKVFEKFVYYEQ